MSGHISGCLRSLSPTLAHYAWREPHFQLRRLNTEDDTIYEVEGMLPDGQPYHAELWQFGYSYHMTIFIARRAGETAEGAAKEIEDALIRFCCEPSRRVEPIFRDGKPVWSYNVAVCDDREQFVSHLPLLWGVSSFSLWYGERQVTIQPVE